MTSREKILGAVKQNQPPAVSASVIERFAQPFTDNVKRFGEVLGAIGGTTLHFVNGVTEIIAILTAERARFGRIVAYNPALAAVAEIIEVADFGGGAAANAHFGGGAATPVSDPHSLADVDLAILDGTFGVAENGALWITDQQSPLRVLPFITQHLAVIVRASEILSTMHDAYDRIGDARYGFGTFIAGPSKTADIEQSLVLGAHGPRTMTVFIVS